MTVRGQRITAGMGQVIGISIPAIEIVMNLYEVKDKRKCLIRVLNTFNHFMKEMNDNEG